MSRIITSKKILLRNVFSNAFFRGVSGILGFLVTPFLLLRLGPNRYGVFILLSTVAGYVFILDVGISKSYTKFVAEFNVRHDDAKINSLINTSIVFYFFVAVLVMGILLLFSSEIIELIKVPSELHTEAQLALLMIGTSLIITLPMNWTVGVLMGLQRFDKMNLIQAAVALLTNAGLVIITLLGGGLPALVGITLVGTLIANILYVVTVRRLLPNLHIRVQFDPQMFRTLFRMGWKMQVDSFSTFLLFTFNRIPIAMIVGPSGVTVFELGMKIAALAMSVVSVIPTAFVPAASELFAMNQESRVRNMFLKGSTYLSLIYLPLFAFIALVSKELFHIWLGNGFESSANVCIILMVMAAVQFSTGIMSPIAIGKGNVEIGMFFSLIVSISYLLLVFVLLNIFGTVGAAVALLIAVTIGEAYYWHAFHRKVLYGSMLETIRRIFLAPGKALLVSVAIFFVAKAATHAVFSLHSTRRLELFIYVSGLAVVYFAVYLTLILRANCIDREDYIPTLGHLLHRIRTIFP